MTDSTSLRTLGREESFYAHEKAEIEVWRVYGWVQMEIAVNAEVE